ncbi:MAG: polynucleotide adenylyltransferase PcnB [Pseudomonadota bacterium]
MIGWLKSTITKIVGERRDPGPRIVPRAEHGVSRSLLSDNVLKVLTRLHKHGYAAYMVGGGVRDTLLGREPKDFDVATDATPEEVRALFRNSRVIGRRFKLVHVRFGPEIIEVATFRGDGAGADSRDHDTRGDGMVVRDNVYGTLEEDAWRRDFTINALYYNIADFSVVDYCSGLDDLDAGLLRLIGDPDTRFREDPVRILRAIRFSAKHGFRVERETEAPMRELGELLNGVPPARLFEEVLKLFLGGAAVSSYELLRYYDVFRVLFPLTEEALQQEEEGFPLIFLVRALENTDRRVVNGQPVTPAFLFAALLWEPVRQEVAILRKKGKKSPNQAMQDASESVIGRQVRHVAFPKRFSMAAREIWLLQGRFEQRGGRRAWKLMEHPRFRAAYDFLVLRAQAGEADEALADWWTRFQDVDEAEREAMVEMLAPSGKGGKRSKGGGRGKPAPEAALDAVAEEPAAYEEELDEATDGVEVAAGTEAEGDDDSTRSHSGYNRSGRKRRGRRGGRKRTKQNTEAGDGGNADAGEGTNEGSGEA